MSDILFCETDMDKFFTGGTASDMRDYQLSALFRLGPDVLGLRVWDQWKDVIDFSKYKLIWIHLDPRIMIPAWHDFPALIKRKAPNAILVGTHEYNPMLFKGQPPFVEEKYFQPNLPHVIKRAIEVFDYWVVPDAPSVRALSKMVETPILYYHIGNPQPDKKWYKPLDWNRRKGLVFISHSINLPMVRKFEIAKKADLPVIAISTNPLDETAASLQHLADAVGVKARCYDRLPWDKYLQTIRRARVGLEIDYIGICRFSYECSKLNIPVVGNELAEYRKLLFPELTFSDPDDMAGTLKALHDGPEPKHLNSYASNFISTYWNEEACDRRMKELLEEVGYGR